MKLRALIVVLATAVALGACTKDTNARSSIKLVDPGHCTPIDIAVAPEVAPVVKRVADKFNDAPAAHPGGKTCSFVRIQTVESGTAAQQLVNGWPDTDNYGPAPAAWIPASSAWAALVNQQLAAAGRPPATDAGTSLARTPTVIAMPGPMAHALGWPARKVGWRDLANLASDKRGWGAHGHPEWGRFKLAKASPARNTSGLLATVAAAATGDNKVPPALESAVVYYGDSSAAFLDTLYRLDKEHAPPTFASAIVTDERLVSAYNAGDPTGDGKTRPKPHVPLVAISPDDGAFDSDNPVGPITASWVDEATQPGVAAFSEFARAGEAQSEFAADGFRTGGTPDAVALAAFRNVKADLDQWKQIRKPARVMLLIDESDSMGDPADWRYLPVARLTLAKRALFSALDEFGPQDEVGLRVFTTGLKGGPSPYWADVVKMNRFTAKQRAALVNGVRGLTHTQGSPLYTAAHDAFDAVNRGYDPTRINGVVLLTDGYNEIEQLNNLDALLAHLHEPVRMFTVSFGADADLASLRKIAQATNGRVYDSTDPTELDTELPDAVSNFSAG
jgi:Ca-activated chloride channel family protein